MKLGTAAIAAFAMGFGGCSVPVPRDAETSRDPLENEIAGLLAKLGAEKLTDREAAQSRLFRLGQAAAPYLAAALDQDDSEVSVRVRAILKELNRKPIRGVPAEDMTWKGIFGTRVADSDGVYCLLGTGFFATPHSEDTGLIIQQWLREHPRARVVVVAEMQLDSKSETKPGTTWFYAWIEDDDEFLNVHLVERGAFPGVCLEPPVEELRVSPAEFQEFIRRVRAAQKRARAEKSGIWHPDASLSTSLLDPWQVRAGACLFEEAWAEAITELKAGLEDGPSSVIWTRIAECHDKLGDPRSALDAYDKQLGEYITEEAILGRASLVSRLDGPDKAVAWLKDFEGRHPDKGEIGFIRGTFYKSEKRYPEAIEVFQAHVERSAKAADYDALSAAFGELAECQLLAGDPKAALLTAARGISAGKAERRARGSFEGNEIEAGDAGCRIVRARIRLSEGRTAEARSDLEAALTLANATADHKNRQAAEVMLRRLKVKSD